MTYNVFIGTLSPTQSINQLGGFAISAWVSLLWQHSASCEMSSSACTLHGWFS